jgi:peptidoglycan hydrolase-like protein with peptidoglycan-binding domain
MLKQGDVGVCVAMMQAALLYHGYDPKWIDGDFGNRSHNMLMAFQAEKGLVADGICGAESWAALTEERQ